MTLTVAALDDPKLAETMVGSATVAFLIFSHQPTQPARYGRRVVVGDRAATGMTPDPPVPPAPAHTPPVGAGGTTNRKAER